MNFIKKIFEDKVDDLTHQQFVKFSKGIFENKAMLDINVTAKKIKIKTSPEYANELVELLAKTIKGKTKVKGILFFAKDLRGEAEIEFQEVKYAMGVRKHFINQELTKEQILNLIEKFPGASLNFTFETDYGSLKVKEKAPKSGKPSKKKGGPKAGFCVFTTDDKEILKDYAFDVRDGFKKALINHTYQIDELVIPKEIEHDFEKARVEGRRKGKILRILDIDGEHLEKQHDLLV